jgi:ABC-type glycerol-3-phosphate transport system permease component
MLGALVRVVAPLSRQGVIITGIFSFSLAMQEFLYAVVYAAPRSACAFMNSPGSRALGADHPRPCGARHPRVC